MISPRHVLSAAHCFSSFSDDPLDYEVWLGKFQKEKTEAGKEQRLAVEKITLHPDYAVQAPYDSDLAILQLAAPGAQFTNFTQPICLQSPVDFQNRQLPHENTTCYVTGFGLTKGTGGDLFLKQASVPIVAIETCKAWSEALRVCLVLLNLHCLKYILTVAIAYKQHVMCRILRRWP